MTIDEHLATLFPREVVPKHEHHDYKELLHLEARRRSGDTLSPDEAERLERWLHEVRSLNAVVRYDPETLGGFFLLPRLAGDGDLIHRPERTEP